MNLATALEIIAVILALISVIIGALQLQNNNSQDLPEIKESPVVNNNIVNNNIVVTPPNPIKERTPSLASLETGPDSGEKATDSPKEQPLTENPSVVGSNTEITQEPEPSIRSSQVKQPFTTSQIVEDSTETGGIGEYVSGSGYRLTNEYEKNSLPPNCPERSVLAYCSTSDSCVDCDGKCWLPGTYTGTNGVISICSDGKWRIS